MRCYAHARNLMKEASPRLSVTAVHMQLYMLRNSSDKLTTLKWLYMFLTGHVSGRMTPITSIVIIRWKTLMLVTESPLRVYDVSHDKGANNRDLDPNSGWQDQLFHESWALATQNTSTILGKRGLDTWAMSACLYPTFKGSFLCQQCQRWPFPWGRRALLIRRRNFLRDCII